MKKCMAFWATIGVLCLLSFPHDIMSQECGGKKPYWATPAYERELKNSYLEVVVLSGRDAGEIREKARQEIAERRRLKVGERDAWIKSGHKAEYFECNDDGLTGYFLYQTPRTPDPSIVLEKVDAGDKYPFSARVFVPGMAQIYKGSIAKGAAIISLETLAVGGVVACEVVRASYDAMIPVVREEKERQRYIDMVSTMQNARNICIAGVAAVYVWNVIDGIVARGRPYVSVNGRMLSFVPYAAPSFNGTLESGLALVFNF